MVTFFCLLLFQAFPHELDIPLPVVILSLVFDLYLGFRNERNKKENDVY